MPKNQFNAAQTEHLNIYLPDYISKLDACATTPSLSVEAGNSDQGPGISSLCKLDLVKHTRAKCLSFVRYPVVANCLLETCMRKWWPLQTDVIDKGTNDAGAYQMEPRGFQHIHSPGVASLCQSGIIGDAEILLFYAFREPDIGDLKAGTSSGYDSPYPITLTEDGIVVFPSIELDEIPPATLRHLLEEFLKVLEATDIHDFETLAIAEFLTRPSLLVPFQKSAWVQPDRAISPPLESPPPAIRDNPAPYRSHLRKIELERGITNERGKETNDEAQVPDETATKKKRRGVAREPAPTFLSEVTTSSDIKQHFEKSGYANQETKIQGWVVLSEEDEED
ncbi:hypothetical protein B0H13DRAFT_1929634 [Mycena leptocephala]|nr:hypothetical protein B0H13DRAFT_1929634 [Mycena leptocephala]